MAKPPAIPAVMAGSESKQDLGDDAGGGIAGLLRAGVFPWRTGRSPYKPEAAPFAPGSSEAAIQPGSVCHRLAVT